MRKFSSSFSRGKETYYEEHGVMFGTVLRRYSTLNENKNLLSVNISFSFFPW